MTTGLQMKTILRPFAVISLACVLTSVLVGPPAGAAQDGYGAASMDAWHSPSLIEGRSSAIQSGR